MPSFNHCRPPSPKTALIMRPFDPHTLHHHTLYHTVYYLLSHNFSHTPTHILFTHILSRQIQHLLLLPPSLPPSHALPLTLPLTFPITIAVDPSSRGSLLRGSRRLVRVVFAATVGVRARTRARVRVRVRSRFHCIVNTVSWRMAAARFAPSSGIGMCARYVN